MTRLHSDVYGEIPLTPHALTVDGNTISGSELLSYKGRAGEIQVQQQFTENYSFYHASFQFNNRTIVSFPHARFALQSLVALNQDVATHMEGAGNFILRKEHVLITYNPSSETSFVFEKDKNYFAFGSSFHLDFVCKYLQAFFQQEAMTKFSAANFFAIAETSILASRKILDVIGEIVHNKLPPQITSSFTSIKMKELFVLQLARAFSKPEPKIKLSERQFEALEEIRQLMLEDITKHHPPKELCKRARINMHILKNGFKEVFGLPPYEYLKEATGQHHFQFIVW